MANSELAHDPTLAASHRNTAPAPGRGGGERLVEGTACGEYVVDRFLGAGAMGEVYAGRHPLIGKKVAIKVLKRDLSASAEASERFLREARAVNQVDHPNVIDVFAFGTLADGRLYLVMDLVDGRSLRQAVGDGPLPVPVALDVLGQIADALDAAHARGVVHRDLKPDNVMLAGEPPQALKVFVLDFGIAKLVTNNGTLNGNGTLTGEGSWLGTPGYMAPEQWSAEGAGPASDRYALGVMAFELLSGKLPFQAPTLPQMMEQHFRAPVPALATRRGPATKDVPPPPPTLDPVLARAMAKDPTKRFATAKELVAALREASAGRRFAGPPKKLWIPAVAGAGVLGLAIAAVVVTRGDDKRPATAAGELPPTPNPDRPPPPAGQVTIAVASTPAGSVVRNGAVLGETPIDVAVTPGEVVSLEVKRIGYATARLTFTADKAEKKEVELVPIVGFRGTWKLANGELRKFERVDDHVMGYKLQSLDDPGRTYRRFELVDPKRHALDADVSWLSHETTNEGPHPSCQVAFDVVFAYKQQPEQLEAHIGVVKLVKQHDGTCLQTKRAVDVERLARVVDGGEEITIRAPVGKPKVKEVVKPILDPKQEELRRLEEAKQQKLNAKPTPKGKRPGNDKANLGNALDDEQQTAPPQKDAVPPPQQQANPPPVKGAVKQSKAAPIQAQAQPPPRGDSQIAPQQATKK